MNSELNNKNNSNSKNSELNRSKKSIKPYSYEYHKIKYILARATLLRIKKTSCNKNEHVWVASAPNLTKVCHTCGQFQK